jgi:hypothetical protein
MQLSKRVQLTILSAIAVTMICMQACSNLSKTNNGLLAGMYKLYKIESQDSAGIWSESGRYNGGESYILYDGLGHMAVQITPKGYKDFNWLTEEQSINEKIMTDKIDSMSIPELKAALAEFASNYTYVANYSLDDSANVVTHNRIISSIPSIWDTEVKRKFSFSGDSIILQPLTDNRRLIWIRQK